VETLLHPCGSLSHKGGNLAATLQDKNRRVKMNVQDKKRVNLFECWFTRFFAKILKSRIYALAGI
jgi:hypothetical protein